MKPERIAVILFNLGGPDSLESVRPFLFNLFNDPAILRVFAPFRRLLAWLISTSRASEARKRYALMGGSSPQLPQTMEQAKALQAALNESGEIEAHCFVAMRYWRPFTDETIAKVSAISPNRVVLLPLYPQFSTTTTASSLAAWLAAGGRADHVICCYPAMSGLVSTHARNSIKTWQDAGKPDNARLLFSAHGLPEKVIADGDPYQWQIEHCAKAVIEEIGSAIPGLDHEICYQSRIGPVRWLGPSTMEAINRAIDENRTILICPISFVGEHIETLVEIDMEYQSSAKKRDAVLYRVPAPGVSESFIFGLAELVRASLSGGFSLCSGSGERLCGSEHSCCPAAEKVDV